MSELSATAMTDSEPVKVLVVDDLPEKRLVLETVLRDLGPGVHTLFARSGEEALQRVLEHEFAVILLDINMPGMDGLETAGFIRARRKSAHTPIIFMTAFADEILTHRGYSLGAVDYVLSPIDPAVLRTKVGVFVELSRKTQQILRQAEERIALVHEQAARAAAEEATRRSQFLSDASKRLAASLELDETLNNLARLTVPTLADMGFVTLVSATDELQRTRFFVASGDRKAQPAGDAATAELPPLVEQLLCEALATRNKVRLDNPPLTFGDIAGVWDSATAWHTANIRTLVAYPLSALGKIVGIVTLATGAVLREPSAAETALADELIDRGSMALENARLYQDVREADQRKDEFLAMLAHELRNPLAPIRNAAQILRLVDAQDAIIATARDTIDRQVTHMARLIDDLLDVSRLARGKILLKVENVDLGQLLANVCDDFRPLLEQAGLKLSVEIAPVGMCVSGDPVRLAQIFANVLQNAAKFTNVGGRVEVVAGVDQPKNAATVRVRDTGIGMESQMVAKAFDAFSQADRSLDRSHGGLGLGLALVKGLVELHQGVVRAASEGLERGTEIGMDFPLSEVVEPPAPLPETESFSETQHRILIVEDNRDAATMLQMMLSLSGHEVEVAYDGAAALAVAERFSPSVVLCDIGLPGEFNGYSVAETLRQRETIAGALLVAVTGYGRAEDRQKSMQAGFDAHLTKPISLKYLTGLLQRHVV